MDFDTLFENSAHQIDWEVERILADFLNEIKNTNIKLLPLSLAFINSCKGGKRIRGVLVKLGFKIAGGSETAEILKIGAAFEILHTAILIHDDVIDQSPLRRGQPTLYKALGGGHYGISQAIGLGDVGLYLPIRIISGSNFLGEYKIKAIHHLSQTIINTGLGEILDVELAHLKTSDKEDVISIYKLKTAQYTVSGPLILGSILAGAEEDLINNLAEFGHNLGIAFQIQDDILGIFGSEKETGKSTSSDIEEGKSTLLLSEALKKANPNQKKILEKYYGKGEQAKENLEKVRKVFKDTGTLDYSRKIALEYTLRAKNIVAKITTDPKMKILLEDLIKYVVERMK